MAGAGYSHVAARGHVGDAELDVEDEVVAGGDDFCPPVAAGVEGGGVDDGGAGVGA